MMGAVEGFCCWVDLKLCLQRKWELWEYKRIWSQIVCKRRWSFQDVHPLRHLNLRVSSGEKIDHLACQSLRESWRKSCIQSGYKKTEWSIQQIGKKYLHWQLCKERHCTRKKRFWIQRVKAKDHQRKWHNCFPCWVVDWVCRFHKSLE